MTFRQFELLLVLRIIWGASFLFIKVAIVTIPPFTIVLAAGQMIGGTLIIAPFSLILERPWTLSPTFPALLSLL